MARGPAGDGNNLGYQRPSNGAFLFLFACACSAIADGLVNSLSSSGRRITMHSSHIEKDTMRARGGAQYGHA